MFIWYRATVLAVLSLILLTPAAAQGEPPRIEPDLVYGHKDGLAMTMDAFYPAEPDGAAMVFLVSGGWYSHWAPPESLVPMMQPFLDRGFICFAVRHGSSPRYGIPDATADVRRAMRYLRHRADELQIDPEKLGVMGMSAGGHLALMLATTGDDGNAGADDPIERAPSRIGAAVALVPPSDLRIMVWEAEESLPEYRRFPALDLDVETAGRYSPLLWATAKSAPSLIIAGGRDTLVPPEHARWIHDALQEQGAESKLVVYPEAGHGLEGTARQQAMEEAVEWLEKQLR